MVALPDDGGLRKRVAELKRKLAALEAEETRTTLALSKSAVGVFDWNLDKKTVFVSPILQDMLGAHGEGLHPDPILWINYLHPEDRFPAESAMREALMYGRDFFHCVCRVIRKDGKERKFIFRAVIMRHAPVEGDAYRVLGTAIDVTHVL